MDVPEGFPASNISFEDGPLETITDLRGIEQRFNMDNNGFEIRNHEFHLSAFDTKSINDEYLPQVEEFIKKEIKDAEKVVIFNWQVRCLLAYLTAIFN